MAADRGNNSLYFVNGVVDCALLGGLSLAAYLAARLVGPRFSADSAYTISGLLVWVVNWPHFSASTHRLYGAKDHYRQYPMTSWLIPAVVLLATVGALLSPQFVAPYFVKVFMVWSPYHFSGQTLGLTLVYARRAGYPISRWDRLFLSTFIFGSFLVSTLAAETSMVPTSYYGIPYAGWGLPAWTVTVTAWAMSLAGVAFLGRAAYFAIRNRRFPAPVIFLLPITQFVWFVPGMDVPSFYTFVPFFHSLQYLFVAWAVQMASAERFSMEGLIKRSTSWFALNLLGGALLFYALPNLVARLGFPVLFASGIIVTGVQIHHFFVDGVIWKLRRKTVVSPLMAHLPNLVEEPLPLGVMA